MADPGQRRLLVLHGGALGDCALTIRWARGVARSIKAELTMAARSPLVLWAEKNDLVARGVLLDAIGAARLYVGRSAADDGVRESAEEERLRVFLRSFDCIVSLLGGVDAPVSRRLRAIGCGDVYAIDSRPMEETLRAGNHIFSQWTDSLRQVGLDLDPSVALVPAVVSDASFVDGQERRDADHARGALDRGATILVHPGSGGLAKCCPIEAMEALVGRLTESGSKVRWMVGPDEVERFGDSYINRLEQSAVVVCEESVERAASTVARVDAYIGNDAGMTHVAALCGIRTVVLFGPTDPRVWRPLGRRVRVGRFPGAGEPVEAWCDAVVCSLT
ncbi:MAG: hypothetical protein IIB61_09405 [Planctomycetes bacterium]|nr:hypothetical protein [Planctomycetota bacterium]